MKRDIVVTWPKYKPLDAYLAALDTARLLGEVVNYRVARPPEFDFGAHHERPGRCYIVFDGAVRGYNEIQQVVRREAGEVRNVDGGEPWPEGWYVVRFPEWHELEEPIPMRGFRGWRWFEAPDPGMPCPCGKAWSFTACLVDDGEELPEGLYCKRKVSPPTG